MLYADRKGRIFSPEEYEALPCWRTEHMGIHVLDEKHDRLDV